MKLMHVGLNGGGHLLRLRFRSMRGTSLLVFFSLCLTVATAFSIIYVKDYPYAEKTEIVDDELACLITNDHIINIGCHVFADWEIE